MGTLKIFNLEKYITEYNIDTFIETGTYLGDSLDYASKFNFESLYSIELLDEFYNKCCDRFNKNSKIFLIKNNSVDGLMSIVSKIENKNCLFWLDAHLPDFYDKKYGDNYIENEKLFVPLEQELLILKQNKNLNNDVLIIDDLRIYENGDFQSGNWNGYLKKNKSNKGIKFIFDILSETHVVKKDYRHEGYIICYPKKNNL